MSKIKNWMMEMQEEADFALHEGAKNSDDVIFAMRNARMRMIDEHWVRQYVNERLGDEED